MTVCLLSLLFTKFTPQHLTDWRPLSLYEVGKMALWGIGLFSLCEEESCIGGQSMVGIFNPNRHS